MDTGCVRSVPLLRMGSCKFADIHPSSFVSIARSILAIPLQQLGRYVGVSPRKRSHPMLARLMAPLLLFRSFCCRRRRLSFTRLRSYMRSKLSRVWRRLRSSPFNSSSRPPTLNGLSARGLPD